MHYGDRYAPTRELSSRMELVGKTSLYDVYSTDISLQSRRFQYLFEIIGITQATLTMGADGIGCNLAKDRPFQYAQILKRDLFKEPEWVSSAICYEIFPDRFHRSKSSTSRSSKRALVDWSSEPTSSDFFGGTLSGIREKIPYLEDLGVNLLYLTPIFKARTNHRYDIEDYYTIDPLLGTKADLVDLVSHAHEHGMRIILDAVFNHTSDHFFAFEEAVREGPASEFWDWYFIFGDRVSTNPVNYETFANGIAGMPKLNFSHPKVESYFLEVARYWITEAKIDGWRLDVANEVDHTFWRRFRDVVKTAQSQALIIGEVWHDPTPWLYGDQFDGVMNYRFRTVIEDFFVERKIAVSELACRMDDLQFSLPRSAAMSNFNLLGSHDTERIFTLLAEDIEQYLLVLVVLLTWQGIPMIYYGDEISMVGGADPSCRRGMDWQADLIQSESYRAVEKLIKLRGQHQALTKGTIRIDHDLASQHILQYTRSYNGDTVIVTLNLSDEPISLPNDRKVWFTTQTPNGKEIKPRQAAIWTK